MCGIIGYVGHRSASKILTDGLKCLEYRGYDSVGIAVLNGQNLEIRKDKGMVADVSSGSRFDSLSGSIGIGHSRWATHGGVSKENSHPHSDCTGSIAIIHNGVIENYQELKSSLLSKGHKFASQTDSEVVSHLFEENLKQFPTPLIAFSKTISALEGSYAIVLLSKSSPDVLFLARKNSPLVVGKGAGENFCASDFSALLTYTREFLVLEDSQIATIDRDSIALYDLLLTPKTPSFLTIDWDVQTAERSGHPHFMIKEILEQPDVVSAAFSADVSQVLPLLEKFEKIHIIASGTSYHAGLLFSILLNKYKSGKFANVFIASEYQNQVLPDSNALIFAISQSGETADVLQALRYSTSPHKVCITNTQGSSITRLCSHSIYLNAGPESSVAATKTFLAQLCVIYKLLFGDRYRDSIRSTILASTKHSAKIQEFSKSIITNRFIFFLSRGLCLPLGFEGSLKLKEISYLHSQAYPAGELKHGTLSLIEKGVCALFLAPKTPDATKLFGNLKEVKARGGTIFTLTDDPSFKSESDMSLDIVPQTDPLLYPFSFVVPLQLLAYYSSVSLGINPDRPRNLAKSVTVE
ncbi:glutamine--fructose-6-phosphate transaminase (isomerizing) [Candidatus Micrarchaeota archaeon]|nr:glutamine--fructose-6-phosphate transaminase (isomerizing) [Candidatus Micrarchaeota archaeon]